MKKNQKIIIGILLLIIGILTTYLFYNQAINKFYSDLSFHIDFALKGSNQYSITGIFYKIIYQYIGGAIGIAIFLSIVTILNIFITKKLLSYYIKSKSEFVLWTYAILLNFVIGIYLPFVSNGWNIGVQSPNKWHNSTYICMKPLGLMAILYYLKIEKEYLQKINWGDYIIFVIMLILVNCVKPNFIIVFAPTMLIFLIIDLFKNIDNKQAIRNIIIFGTAVLISLPILIYQNSVMFSNETETGITLGFMTFLIKFNNNPIVALFQPIVFPLFILITNLNTNIKERRYSFILVFNIIALIEYLYLQEKGTRMYDGNFTWGYSFALMIGFIGALSFFIENKKQGKYQKEYYISAYVLLSLHIISGLIYFGRLLLGYNYY